jgi:hypothetical protein
MAHPKPVEKLGSELAPARAAGVRDVGGLSRRRPRGPGESDP